MLASSAADVDEALARIGDGPVAVDAKLDGIRVQVHKHDGRVARLHPQPGGDHRPGARGRRGGRRAAGAHRWCSTARRSRSPPTGRARPFQETGARTASRVDVATLRAQVPLTSYFFDLLHVDGEDLVDSPGHERFDRLAAVLPPALVVPRTVTADPAEARRLFADVVAAGHEGVVVKSLDAPYDAGRRGAGWVKVKPRHTLDLVVLAVEWGSGRRQGWLSNIHLGARDPETGGFVMLGKTFKGMTDEMLAWQTERFLALEESRSAHVVTVRPEQVVEIAFDGIQTSTRYPAGDGAALRPGAALPRRQDRRRGGHGRDGARAAPGWRHDLAPGLAPKPDGRRTAAAARRRRRETEILDATRALFDARGVRDAQIEDIANAVGINRAIIYRHFSGKEELFALTLVGYLEQLAGRLQEADREDASPEDRLRAITAAFVDYGLEFPAFVDCALTLMRRPGPELLDEISEGAVYRLGRGISTCLAPVAAAIQAGVDTGVFHTDDVHLLANTLYASGLGGLQLARVGMVVKEAAPGVPTVAALSAQQVKEHLIASSVAMAIGAGH